MSSAATVKTELPVFPRIELNGPRTSSESAMFNVVRSADLAKADHDRQLVARAWIQADEIVADAHLRAEAYLAQVHTDTATARSAWYADREALFDSRTADAIDLLCRATGRIAEAVIASIFEQMPALPIQASVEIAVRLLRAEMRSHVLCNLLDFEMVNAASTSLGAVQTQTDDGIRRGELMFRDAQGEVRVDGTDALRRLLDDWKTTLVAALPVAQLPPSSFTHPPQKVK